MIGSAVNGAAPFAIAGLACGVVISILLVALLVVAKRGETDRERWEAMQVETEVADAHRVVLGYAPVTRLGEAAHRELVEHARFN